MEVTVDADYLVLGAGAMGMAFADALADHADVSVAIVDRRFGAGGHWLDDYPFVRLHQASVFYGVPSTRLGGGRLQENGPERGLQERASAAEICEYYARVAERLAQSGKVTFHSNCEFVGDGRFVSRLTGRRFVAPLARLVDARYLSPGIPALTPPPFEIDGAHVIPVNGLVHLSSPPSRFVLVGAGKTAMDAGVWLLRQGVAADAITWVRPRDPWLLNRAVVQPDPAIFLGMAADTMTAATEASSADDFFLRMEAAGVMLRIDRAVTPTMAKTPTLATWELELLRSIEDVVRRGHLRKAERGRLCFAEGDVRIPDDAVIVHCAAPGVKYPGLVPIWRPGVITPQPVRAGFPCFGAALAGYVEATRDTDDEKNAVCRPSPYADTPIDWAAMQVIGGDASLAMAKEDDIRRWSNDTTLNPSRIPPERADDPVVVAAVQRLRESGGAARQRLAELAAT
uniref:NAD(P)-binding protein n=1 Tax=Microbacterium sp. CPCC 204701 TaxID=2493084 RepID=UPI001F0C55C8